MQISRKIVPDSTFVILEKLRNSKIGHERGFGAMEWDDFLGIQSWAQETQVLRPLGPQGGPRPPSRRLFTRPIGEHLLYQKINKNIQNQKKKIVKKS